MRVEWDLFSLKAVNAGTESLKAGHFKSDPTFRVMALLRRTLSPEEANDAIDRLYLAVGQASHEDDRDIGEREVMAESLAAAGLQAELLDAALADDTLLDDLLRSHESGLALGAFGVPALVLERPGQQPTRALYGPVISEVPLGDEALAYWEHINWLMQRPEFFELKRGR